MTEDQLRLEYKLDLIISALQDQGVMLRTADLPDMKGMHLDDCPACGKQVRVTINLSAEELNRACGCVPPVRAVPGISALNTPAKDEHHAYSRLGPDQEVSPEPPPEGGGHS